MHYNSFNKPDASDSDVLTNLPVIPANAGIQGPKFIPCCLDTGFRRYEGINTNAFL